MESVRSMGEWTTFFIFNDTVVLNFGFIYTKVNQCQKIFWIFVSVLYIFGYLVVRETFLLYSKMIFKNLLGFFLNKGIMRSETGKIQTDFQCWYCLFVNRFLLINCIYFTYSSFAFFCQIEANLPFCFELRFCFCKRMFTFHPS